MGSKKAISTIFDTLSSLTKPDYKFHSGRNSRDPSPSPKTCALLEEERVSKQNKNVRREVEQQQHKDRASDPWVREGKRELDQRGRRQEDDKSQNGRLLSNVENTETEQRVKKKGKKGDTFPRMREVDRGPESTPPEMEEDRRQRDGQMDNWEKKRQMYRESEGRQNPRRRHPEDERTVKSERYTFKMSGVELQERTSETIGSRDTRAKEAARRREKLRADVDEAEMYLFQMGQERERYAERKERTQRKERMKDARNEGDLESKMRAQMKDREREEATNQFIRNEELNRSKMPLERDKDGQRKKDMDRARRREEDNRKRSDEVFMRTARQVDREKILRMERKFIDDRRVDDQYRNERRYKTCERQADKSNRSMNDSAQRPPPQVQSGRERISDGDIEKYRQDRDMYREKERRSRQAVEGERIKERCSEPEGAADRSQKQQIRSEKQGRHRRETTNSLPEKKRMWLEPQRGKTSEDRNSVSYQKQKRERRREEMNVESMEEKGRPKSREKAEPDERNLEQSYSKRRHGGRDVYSGDSEGVSADGDDEVSEIWTERRGKEHLSDSCGKIEERRQGDVQGEIMANNTEESDTDEDGGCESWAPSGSERGNDDSWKQDRILSGENMVVTLSSGGDEEEERENYPKEFKNYKNSCEAGASDEDPTPDSSMGSEGDDRDKSTTRNEEVVNDDAQGRQKKPKYVFFVAGQSHSRSKTTELSSSEDDEVGGVKIDEPNSETLNQSSDEAKHESQDAQQLTSSRNDKQSDYSFPIKVGLPTGDTAEEDIRYNASKELQDVELRGEMRSKVEPVQKGLREMKRDSKTERLLVHWRENNKGRRQSHADTRSRDSLERIPPFLDDMNIETMSQEEMEEVRIRMSGAWTTSKEPKRHSQAPHLKWATSVVREILGQSDEQAVDEPKQDQGAKQIKNDEEKDIVPQRSLDLPIISLTRDDQNSDPELEEEDLEGDFKGMGQTQADIQAGHVTAIHVVTPSYTNTDTHLNTEGKENHTIFQKTELFSQLARADIKELREKDNEKNKGKEVEEYLMINTLYKPDSCPVLNYDSESDLLTLPKERRSQEVKDEMIEGAEDRQTEEGNTEAVTEKFVEDTGVEVRKDEIGAELKAATVTKSSSFLNMSPELRVRRRAIRKTNKQRDEDHVDVEEDISVGRDRRARVFSPTDVDCSKSLGEVNLRNAFDKMARLQGNSSFLNAALLYQQYNEAAQNIEILRQFRSVGEDPNLSPMPSPPPARRPLPPIPPVPPLCSLTHAGSVTSAKDLPLPDIPTTERRPSSPRLSVSLTQPSALWRELPEVRNNPELEMLTEDQRRLQEVRFEVLTSEASYCRSLDIVVDHFIKSKQLGMMLTTQDKNWLFSRLSDVRAISRRFLSKLEERVESDVMHFTVCDIIVKQCPRFRTVYVPYLTNQSYQDATYQKLMNGNPGFKQVVEALEKSPVCQRLPFRSFLVLPFQRITRMRLLVQNIVKRTTPGTVEATNAIKALKLLDKMIQESNDSISQMKNIESLVTLNSKVDFECRTLPLVSQSRRLVREGPVTQLLDFSLKDTKRHIYLHLFNDYLLISVQKEGGRFTVIDHSPVKDLRAENFRVKLLSLQRNVFRLHWTNVSLLLRTETQSDKLRWISAISRPHPELDFSAAEDLAQMQCIRAYVAQQPDELSLEKADVILVHQDSEKADVILMHQDSSDKWVEGTKLSDLHRGWVPKSHLEVITNPKARKHNLSDAYKLTTATAAV